MTIRPNVWGVGLPRTGTTSICEAFKLLGYKRVGHNPAQGQLGELDAGADNGVIVFYKFLDYKFPGSKFVLTLRPLEEWLSSMEHILGRHPVISRDDDVAIMRRMHIFETVSFDRATLTNAYERHHDDVRRYFANRSGDLLELNLVGGEGWEKLCPFLGLPIPSAPFPNLNSRVSLESTT